MIVLWILLGLIALIVIVLHFSVCVYVKGGTSGELVYKITFLGFTVFPRPPKKPKKSKHPKDDEPPELDDTDLEEDFDSFEEPEETPPAQPEDKPPETELTVPEPEETDEPQAEEPPEDKPDKKKRKEKKSKKEDSTPPAEPEKKSRLADLKEKYEFIKPFIPLGWKYFRKLLKAVRFTGLRVNITTGKEDAYESAMFYGKLQIALMSVLTMLGGIFTVQVKEANVSCVFNEKRLDAEGEVTVKVRPSTMIAIGFCLAVKALIIFLRQKLRKRRARKKAIKAARKKADAAPKAA